MEAFCSVCGLFADSAYQPGIEAFARSEGIAICRSGGQRHKGKIRWMLLGLLSAALLPNLLQRPGRHPQRGPAKSQAVRGRGNGNEVA